MAVAAQCFSAQPASTGSAQIDAALAALAEHLARRDGSPTPLWTADVSVAALRRYSGFATRPLDGLSKPVE